MALKACASCGKLFEAGIGKDICPDCEQSYWKCGECGYTLQAMEPPETCPSCYRKCVFKNVTCYTPECGGIGKPDKRL